MKSREERFEEYYHMGTRELAELLIETEGDLQWLHSLVRDIAVIDDHTELVPAQQICRNILDDYTK